MVKFYRAHIARFCSRACGGRWHILFTKMPNDHKYGNKWRKGLRPTNAFTSEQAISMNTVRGNVYQCSYCGKSFEVKPWIERQSPSVSGRRFCSKRCNGKYRSEYLSGENSPQWVGGVTTYRGKGWFEARSQAIDRDKGTCQYCGKFVGSSIAIHHVIPFRNFTNVQDANVLSNLICLCQSCHMRIEYAQEQKRLETETK